MTKEIKIKNFTHVCFLVKLTIMIWDVYQWDIALCMLRMVCSVAVFTWLPHMPHDLHVSPGLLSYHLNIAGKCRVEFSNLPDQSRWRVLKKLNSITLNGWSKTNTFLLRCQLKIRGMFMANVATFAFSYIIKSSRL